MKRKKNNDITMDMIKAYRRASREQDIELHGKPVAFRPVVQENKKKYSRKRFNLGDCM